MQLASRLSDISLHGLYGLCMQRVPHAAHPLISLWSPVLVMASGCYVKSRRGLSIMALTETSSSHAVAILKVHLAIACLKLC